MICVVVVVVVAGPIATACRGIIRDRGLVVSVQIAVLERGTGDQRQRERHWVGCGRTGRGQWAGPAADQVHVELLGAEDFGAVVVGAARQVDGIVDDRRTGRAGANGRAGGREDRCYTQFGSCFGPMHEDGEREGEEIMGNYLISLPLVAIYVECLPRSNP